MKRGQGLCDPCKQAVLGNTASSRNTRLDQIEAARIGPQWSFFVVALIVWPLAFALGLVWIGMAAPHYGTWPAVLVASLLSSGIAAAASWSVLLVSVSQKDVSTALLLLLSPRNFTRIYHHSNHLRRTMPRLFVLHLTTLGLTIGLAFICLITQSMVREDIAKLFGESLNLQADGEW